MNILHDKEFEELSYYTLGHPDTTYFIHQHVVDAYQAQNATHETKRITLIFSLIGLYLYLEKAYTDKQVQLAHMKLARNKKTWTILSLPQQRGKVTVSDVLKAEPGQARDGKIREWCSSVWVAYKNWHQAMAMLAKTELNVD